MSQGKFFAGGKVPPQPRLQPEAPPMMMIRMRCEECQKDHRFLVGVDTPVGALPQIAKETFRCDCKRHIPTFTKMDKSLMSINGVPFRQLKGLFPSGPQGSFN